MKAEEVYIQKVLDRLPSADLRKQIGMELRSHIQERIERGDSVEDAIRQLGEPAILAEAYLAAVPLVSAPLDRRAAAKILDVLVVAAIPALAVALGIWADPPRPGGEPLEHPVFAVALLFGFVFFILGSCLYTMIAEFGWGQTIGKRLFGLRVVTEAGARIGLGQSFLRQLPLFLQIGLVDALFALFTERKQRAFELLSKTRVVLAQEPARRGASSFANALPNA